MPKTTFFDAQTIVTALWLNLMSEHDHKNRGVDGSCPKIDIDSLDDLLKNGFNDLIAIKPLLIQLFFNDKIKTNIFGGFGTDGDFASSGNLNRDVYEYQNFTIANGQTVRNQQGFLRLKCTGNVLIDGSLIVDPINPEGIGKAFYNNGGKAYNIGCYLLGSAGGETVDHTNLSGLQVIRDPGGFGGGCIIIEALGTITVNGTISANGGNGQPAQILSGNPTLGGSGGGSGGTIILQSYTAIQVNGTIDAIGGIGANGYGSNAKGGGGGSGGIIKLISPSINVLTNSCNVNGGNPGSSTGTGINLGGGGGGHGGLGGNSGSSGNTGQVIQIQKPVFSPYV